MRPCPAARSRSPNRALALATALLVVGLANPVLAQAPPATPTPDTPLVFDLVATVTAPRPRHRPVGAVSETWRTDRLPATRSVAGALDRAGVHVRHYGPGALASVSVRGGSAAQTLALWNGLPVTNPSLGQVDWNLLTPTDRQRVTLVRGGHASAWGSGAVAATVHLEDLPPTERGLRLAAGTTLGAFGERGGDVALAYKGTRLSGAIRADGRRLDNDFAYAPAPGLPERRQTNAALAQSNLRAGLYYHRPGADDELAVRYWRQRTTREIPPTTVQARGAAVQDDGADRLSLRYRRRTRRYDLSATAGFFVESLDYRDSLAGVRSESDFAVALADATMSLPLKPHGTLLLGATARHTTARVDEAYEGTPTELAASVLATYTYRRGRWAAQADLRYGRATGQSLGLTPALGLRYRVSQGLLLRARVSRDYRAPTFNDRYYRPGGNPDLRPERSWGAEAGVDFRQNGWYAGLTAYRRRVRDWILWSRQPERAYWSAYNLAAVTSEGLEPRIGYRFGGGDARLRLSLDGGYDLTRSVNEIAVGLPRIEAGEQLSYVPRHGGFASATLTYATLELQYAHRWRGASAGVNDEVAAAQTADLTLAGDYTHRGQRFSAYVALHNVFDVSYELIERRPLPGRHLRIGVRADLRLAPAPTRR